MNAMFITFWTLLSLKMITRHSDTIYLEYIQWVSSYIVFQGRLLVPQLWEKPSVKIWLQNYLSWFSHPKLLLTEHSALMDVFYIRDIQCGCHSPRVDMKEDLQRGGCDKDLRFSILLQLNSVQTEVVTYSHNTEQHHSKTPHSFWGFNLHLLKIEK